MVGGPAQYGTTAPTLRCTKGDGKPAVSRRMPGAGLSLWRSGKAPPDRPAFQPYWGKPAVRNEREDRGNVGIMRSPVRASILPDCGGRSVMSVPTAIKGDSSGCRRCYCAGRPHVRRRQREPPPTRRGQRPQHARTLLDREPGDLPPDPGSTPGPHREGEEPEPMMHGREKSDPAIGATKPPNEARTGAAEVGEPRAGAKGKADQQSTRRALNRASVSQALDRLRQAARQRKKERFTALLHHINLDLLRMAFLDLKRTAAPGVDGLTWQDYEADLEPRLRDLHDRVHRGAYRALPSRRRYIPKADGRARPLAIAALEDKIVQRATVAVLNAIYEEDFLGVSYGFRPRRSQHDTLDALVVGISSTRVNYILDADIRSFFDAVSQTWLIRFLNHRIGDPRIIRLIQKWLRAGVLEDGVVTISDTGTGQGSVISPLLANVYLHYVFDLWAERWRRREAKGDMIIVRYADDIVVGF